MDKDDQLIMAKKKSTQGKSAFKVDFVFPINTSFFIFYFRSIDSNIYFHIVSNTGFLFTKFFK
jgi:hypothetical protein